MSPSARPAEITCSAVPGTRGGGSAGMRGGGAGVPPPTAGSVASLESSVSGAADGSVTSGGSGGGGAQFRYLHVRAEVVDEEALICWVESEHGTTRGRTAQRVDAADIVRTIPVVRVLRA